MKRRLLLIMLCAALNPVWSQDLISLNNLESLFLENNPLVNARKAELKIFDGQILDAKQHPNPSLNTSVDSLTNGSRETEFTVALSQELDLNNKRRWLVRSLEHRKNAQSHQMAFEFREKLMKIKKSFCKAVLLQMDIVALDKVGQTIQNMEKQSQARFLQGDVAEVDVIRLSAENQKVSLLINELENEADFEKKSLAVSLGMGTQSVRLSQNVPLLPPKFDSEELLALAIQNRSDFKAAKARLLGNEDSIVVAKKGTRSPLTIEGGYKGRNGGFKGFVLGISTPLPFSNRNQGKIQELIATREAEQLRVTAVEANVARNIEIAVEKLSFLSNQAHMLTKQISAFKKIAQITRFNYEEGGAGLIEILDAVRSQSDLILDLNRTNREAWFVVFDLEVLTGSNLTLKGDSL